MVRCGDREKHHVPAIFTLLLLLLHLQFSLISDHVDQLRFQTYHLILAWIHLLGSHVPTMNLPFPYMGTVGRDSGVNMLA